MYENNKKDLFDDEIKSLFEQSLEILKLSNNLGMVDDEIFCLKKYMSIYKGMLPSEHHIYFEMLFDKKKKYILNTLDNDSWLKTGNIVIQFGEDVKNVKKLNAKCSNIKIMLSSIYNAACKLQHSAQKILEEVNEASTASNKNLIRPSIILLHLLRIFYSICPIDSEDDKTQLGVLITILEKDLHIKDKTIKVNLPPVNQTAASSISTIFNLAANVMKTVGIPLPDDFEAPTDQQFNDMINNLVNNESTQNIMQTLAGNLKNKSDMGTTVQSMLNTVMDPETLQTVQKSLLQTAEIAKENTLAQNHAANLS